MPSGSKVEFFLLLGFLFSATGFLKPAPTPIGSPYLIYSINLRRRGFELSPLSEIFISLSISCLDFGNSFIKDISGMKTWSEKSIL